MKGSRWFSGGLKEREGEQLEENDPGDAWRAETRPRNAVERHVSSALYRSRGAVHGPYRPITRFLKLFHAFPLCFTVHYIMFILDPISTNKRATSGK